MSSASVAFAPERLAKRGESLKMAIIKGQTTATGATVEYWRIVDVNFRLTAGVVSFILAGYLNKRAREDEREPQKLERFDMAIPEGTAHEAITRKVLYDFVKGWRPFPAAEAPFADAADA